MCGVRSARHSIPAPNATIGNEGLLLLPRPTYSRPPSACQSQSFIRTEALGPRRAKHETLTPTASHAPSRSPLTCSHCEPCLL